MERGRIEGLPKFFEYPLLSQERIKLRTSNFVPYAHSQYRSEQKHFTNFGKSSRGRFRGLSKLLRSPMYWAHRAVIFAIGRLSCLSGHGIQGLGYVIASFCMIIFGINFLLSLWFISNTSRLCQKNLQLCRETVNSFSDTVYLLNVQAEAYNNPLIHRSCSITDVA